MFLEFNENESKIYWNLWDTAVQVRKLISMNTHFKNTERSQINDLMLHLKVLEKQEQARPKTSRREVIKIRTQINEIEIKTKQRINERKVWFFEKINKTDRPLANLK
jgi:hypothetical protein